MFRKQALWLVGPCGVLALVQVATGCGDSFGSCQDSRTCTKTPADGGAAGEAPTDSAGAAGAATQNEQGGEAGASIGGAGNGTPLSQCHEGYSDWLTSSFGFPDGEVIGTADFPSMPWDNIGSLSINTGRLTGAGAAVVSQGTTFPYVGSRLRFRTRFTDSNQEVTAGFNAAKDGSGGVRIEVDGYGRLSLIQGGTRAAFADLAPLEAGVDWFVEAQFDAGRTSVRLSRKNYASETDASVVGAIDTDAFVPSASGTKTAIALASNGGTSPAVDELSFSRCGAKPPAYSEQLVDTFERPDSTVVGHAEVPSTSSWTASSASERILGGALLSEGLHGSTIPLKVSTAGLRIRVAIGAVDGANAYLWADVNYNVAAGEHGPGLPGFWVWGGPKEDGLHIEVFGTPVQELKVPTPVKMGTTYYAELDRDDDIAVLTLRSQSYTGPVLGLGSWTGISKVDGAGDHLTLGDEGGAGTLFHEIRVETYQVP